MYMYVFVCVLPTLSFAWLSLWLRCCRCQRCCCCFCVLMFLLLLIFYDWRSFVGVVALFLPLLFTLNLFTLLVTYAATCQLACYSLISIVRWRWAVTRHGVARRNYIVCYIVVVLLFDMLTTLQFCTVVVADVISIHFFSTLSIR